MSHRHDYIEQFRGVWYPKLHGILSNIGVHSHGTISTDQFYTVRRGAEEFEREVCHDLFDRNPVATYKETSDGRESVGSWVLTYEDAERRGVNPWTHFSVSYEDDIDLNERQLHLTIVPTLNSSGDSVDIFAHEEYDWRDRPYDHLKGKQIYPEVGRTMLGWILDEHTDLDRPTEYFYNQAP